MVDWKEVLTRYAVLGGIAGGLFSVIFWILGMFNLSATIGIPFSTITVTRTGLAGNVGKAIFAPLVGEMTGNAILMSILFGAVFIVVGGVVYELLLKNFLPTNKKVVKLTYVIVAASIAGGWIISRAIAIPALITILVTIANAFVTAWILTKIPAVEKYIP